MTTFQDSFKRIAIVITCAAITIGALSACNTVAGAGKDIKSGGNTIEKTANDAK